MRTHLTVHAPARTISEMEGGSDIRGRLSFDGTVRLAGVLCTGGRRNVPRIQVRYARSLGIHGGKGPARGRTGRGADVRESRSERRTAGISTTGSPDFIGRGVVHYGRGRQGYLEATIRSEALVTGQILLLTAPDGEVLERVPADNPAFTPDEALLLASYHTLRRSAAGEAALRSALFAEVVHESRHLYRFPRRQQTYVVRDLRIRYAYRSREERHRAARRAQSRAPVQTRSRHGISPAALQDPEVDFWCVDHPDWPTPRVVKQEPPFLFATQKTSHGAEGHGFLKTIQAMIDDPTRRNFLSMAAGDFNAMLGEDAGFAPCPEVWKLPPSF